MNESLKTSLLLETERLLLRCYRNEDSNRFFELVQQNSGRLSDNFPIILANTTNEITSKYYLQSLIALWHEQKSFSYGIWYKENNELIGHISIKNIDWNI